MPYEDLQQALHPYGFYLETCEAWYGEPHPDKYILLGSNGSNILTAKTLKPIREFLANETSTSSDQGNYTTHQLTIL